MTKNDDLITKYNIENVSLFTKDAYQLKSSTEENALVFNVPLKISVELPMPFEHPS